MDLIATMLTNVQKWRTTVISMLSVTIAMAVLYALAYLVSKAMVHNVLMSMSATLLEIVVIRMRSVTTLLDLLHAAAKRGLAEMAMHALMLMNAQLKHTIAIITLVVRIQSVHTGVNALLDSLEMERTAETSMNVQSTAIGVIRMPLALTRRARTIAFVSPVILVMAHHAMTLMNA